MEVLKNGQVELQMQNFEAKEMGCGCHYDVFDPTPADCACDD